MGGGCGDLRDHPRGRARPCRRAALLRRARASAGRDGDAVALIERSLELEPDRPDWHSNFGIVLQDRLRLDEAIAAYEHAIALDANHANAHNNLGVVLRAKGRVADAEAAYRAAIGSTPTTRMPTTTSASCSTAWGANGRPRSASRR